jgi:hypothetical protein
MENHNIAWIGMDTDTKNNQVAVYRGWDKEPAAEWTVGMDRKGMEKLIERLKKEDCEVRCVYEAGPCGYELYRGSDTAPASAQPIFITSRNGLHRRDILDNEALALDRKDHF